MKPKPILLFPFNGNAIEAVDCLGDNYELIGFIDDAQNKQLEGDYHYQVFGRDALTRFPTAMVLAVPGSATSFMFRKHLIDGLGIPRNRFATVIHPSASISKRAFIGSNTLLMAGVVVTHSATVGDSVCILPCTVIHHHVKIDDWNLIGSNVTIAGGSMIGPNSYIGSGSSIKNGVKVGGGALIGMGSNVIRDVEPGARVAGNPACQVRSRCNDVNGR
jgi:sugar O-acyltransferase (sialic acid O-acetyltransferase NeuD family)